jgi:glycosyltransferase involved in cell wall biosynthesis
MQRNMIFHYPLPLPQQKLSGSAVHIYGMMEAFKNNGYRVHVVGGYANERKKAVKQIKQLAREGDRFDFLYSESSTAPSLLAKRNLGKPFLEFELFNWCRENQIPVGLFYGDIHWRFDQYKTVARWYKRAIAIPLYLYDWLLYMSRVDSLFLPSLEMAAYLPPGRRREWIHALPPGCDIKERKNNLFGEKLSAHALSLLYVGGVSPPLYNLTPLFESISRSNDASVTLCCRLAEWNDVKEYYQYTPNGKIKIIHVDSNSLAPYYLQSDAFLLAWQPNPYLSFAMPVKLFEAIGNGLPLISISGTLAASFISKENIGWVVANSGELSALYEYLANHPEEVLEKQRTVEGIRPQHTWEVRAKYVASILTGMTAS